MDVTDAKADVVTLPLLLWLMWLLWLLVLMVLAMLFDMLPAIEDADSCVDVSDDNPEIVAASAGVETIVAAAADATANAAAEDCWWCC